MLHAARACCWLVRNGRRGGSLCSSIAGPLYSLRVHQLHLLLCRRRRFC
jgi:hypothetical protein